MATLAERLVEAEAAYHALNTGKMARVYVDQNGERVEYVSTTAGRLWAYICKLKSDIAAGGSSDEGPIRVVFL